MRIVFFLLLFANLGFLAWNRFVFSAEGQIDTAQFEGTQALELVREARPDAERLDMAQVEAAQRSDKRDVSVVETSAVPAVENEQPSGVEASMPENSTTSALEAALAKVDAPAPVVEEPEEQVVETKPLVVAEAPAPQQLCYQYGPISSELDLKRVQRLLAPRVKGLESRDESREEIYGYNVFITAQSSRAAAQRVVEDLKRRGIRDYYIMSGPGKYRHAISVGLFKEESYAVRRVKVIRGYGYEAKSEPRLRTKNRYWLTYMAADRFVPNMGGLKDSRDAAQTTVSCP